MRQDDDSFLDGCAQIYLDFGSNIGVQVRKLFEPHLYPKAGILPAFDSRFGLPTHRALPSSETGLCAVGFEANPAHASRLKEIQESYTRQGWRVYFWVPMAVANATGEITFWTNGLGHKSWGASITQLTLKGRETQSNVTVPQVDIAAWISKYVRGRVIPKHTRPYVLAKFDIEGSEYPVLPHLAKARLFCADVIHEAYIEWHEFIVGKATAAATHAAMRQNECFPAANTAILRVTDESYNNDGKPLP